MVVSDSNNFCNLIEEKINCAYLDYDDADSALIETQFAYACVKISSKYLKDIRNGLRLLEELLKIDVSEERKLDCMYYLAVGHARIKEYSKALKFIQSFLYLRPASKQAKEMEEIIKRRMDQVLLKKITLTGSMVFALGGVITVFFALARWK